MYSELPGSSVVKISSVRFLSISFDMIVLSPAQSSKLHDSPRCRHGRIREGRRGPIGQAGKATGGAARLDPCRCGRRTPRPRGRDAACERVEANTSVDQTCAVGERSTRSHKLAHRQGFANHANDQPSCPVGKRDAKRSGCRRDAMRRWRRWHARGTHRARSARTWQSW